ncbi:UNC45-central domain-containing protein [Aspergillus ruber CBS 135680]|uniref:Putative actin cytoskeleton organization protein n=1 Tax=Aspergillus ruber (strain CBS 135680) TaxID=1388766 RepID=A0A017SAC5_ASPRC|nr:putative actin cytoskeleton organization protein [Aspergillus ruber CBS 135680]EYE93998.1 putative actin cytoskeleton organization protein [Aspergillus ruber CBS 135680]
MLSPGEERAIHLATEAIELFDAGHREAASRNLREALSLAPHHPEVTGTLLKVQKDETQGHHLLDLCRKYTANKDESAGKDASLYLRTDGLKPPEEVALQCLMLLLAERPHALTTTQDDLISSLVRQNTSVRQFFSNRLQVSVTTFFDEIYDRGDGAAVCLDTVVLDPSVWPSEKDRYHCECELFLLFIAKLMESGHDLDGRSLKGIARLLAVDAEKLQHLVDDEGLEVILSSLDSRLPAEWRGQATLATVKYLQVAKQAGEERFSRLIAHKITKARNDDIVVAFSAAVAVFPVSPNAAASLFLSDEFMKALMPLASRSSKNRNVEVALLELLNAACVSTACRETISKRFSDWLSHVLTNGSDETSDLAAVILAKIRTSETTNGAGAVASQTNGKVQEEDSVPELVHRFKELMSQRKVEHVPHAIEGLAFSSVKPDVKEQLAEDRSFLKDLIQILRPHATNSSPTSASSVLYGGLTIIQHLTQFLPNLSEEQKKMAQLKAYANAKTGEARSGPDPRQQDEAVLSRCRAIVEAGAMPLLVDCAKTNLSSIQSLVCQILMSLARDRSSRGSLAQQGAVKVLINMAAPQQGNAGAETSYYASHALARILISVNPALVFPSSGFPSVTSAVRPLVSLLSSPETAVFTADQPRDLLPVFEGLLALTNLASYPDESAPETIVRQGWTVLEDLLLSGHTWIQRAACELVCNLMACEAGVMQYADGSKQAAKRLHVLLALTDVDDTATRKAAGGALAMLTEFESAITAVLDRPRGVELLLSLCQDSDAELQHRGVACIRNLTSLAAGNTGVRARKVVKDQQGVETLAGVLKRTSNPAVLQTGVEALKPIMQ